MDETSKWAGEGICFQNSDVPRGPEAGGRRTAAGWDRELRKDLFLVPETWVMLGEVCSSPGAAVPVEIQRWFVAPEIPPDQKMAILYQRLGKRCGKEGLQGCDLSPRLQGISKMWSPVQGTKAKKCFDGIRKGFTLLLLEDVPSGSFEKGAACAPVLQLAERELCLPGQRWESADGHPWRRLFISSPPRNPSAQKWSSKTRTQVNKSITPSHPKAFIQAHSARD